MNRVRREAGERPARRAQPRPCGLCRMTPLDYCKPHLIERLSPPAIRSLTEREPYVPVGSTKLARSIDRRLVLVAGAQVGDVQEGAG